MLRHVLVVDLENVCASQMVPTNVCTLESGVVQSCKNCTAVTPLICMVVVTGRFLGFKNCRFVLPSVEL